MPVLMIMSFFLIATTFHGTGSTDLLSATYLFYGFYFTIYFREFYTKNTKQLASVRNYNIVVLYFTILFQIPLFMCPAYLPNVTGYVDTQSCSEFVDTTSDAGYDYGDNASKALYIVLVQSLGLSKLFREL